MLSVGWRERKVAAFFSLVHPEPEIAPALLQSLRTSLGVLSAPYLGFVAVRRVSGEALPALHEYQAQAQQKKFGGVSLITALIQQAGGTSNLEAATPQDHLWLDGMTTLSEMIEGS